MHWVFALLVTWAVCGYWLFGRYMRSYVVLTFWLELAFALLCGPFVWLVGLGLLCLDGWRWIKNKFS